MQENQEGHPEPTDPNYVPTKMLTELSDERRE